MSDEYKLLVGGPAYFSNLFQDFERAQSEVLIEVYIFQLDSFGREMVKRLTHCAERGVRVRVVADAFGSPNFGAEEVERFRSVGIEISLFRPISYLRLSDSFFRRLHRKVVTIDRKVSYIGGFNFADDYARPESDQYKWDIGLRLEGVIAETIAQNTEFLLSGLSRTFRSLFSSLHPSRFFRTLKSPTHVQYLIRDHFLSRSSIERAYRQAIVSAQHTITLANAYFFPTRGFLKALQSAARRGVRVRLLLQGRAEFPVLKGAESYLYSALVRSGVELYEYTPHFLHAKVAVIDDYWLTIGSSNLDPWSLISNIEGNVVVQDAELAKQLEAALNEAITKHSKRVELRTVPLMKKALYWISYQILRLGVRLAKSFTFSAQP